MPPICAGFFVRNNAYSPNPVFQFQGPFSANYGPTFDDIQVPGVIDVELPQIVQPLPSFFGYPVMAEGS